MAKRSSQPPQPINAPPAREPRELPPLAIQVVALTAVVMATAIIFWAAVSPAHFELPVAQFFACVGVSLYLAVFFFVFWPQRGLSAPVLPFFAKREFRVAGPIVLFFLSLGIIWSLIPKPTQPYTQFIAPEVEVYYDDRTTVERADKRPLNYHLVRSTTKRDFLEGICVQFPPGEDTIDAILVHAHLRQPITLRRGKFMAERRGG
jgi:hypothetical protein